MMCDDQLQEWTLQSTDGQPVTLTFNSFDVGMMLPTPSTGTTTGTSYIWSPNYPNNYYDYNYQQVREALKYFWLQTAAEGPFVSCKKQIIASQKIGLRAAVGCKLIFSIK